MQAPRLTPRAIYVCKTQMLDKTALHYSGGSITAGSAGTAVCTKGFAVAGSDVTLLQRPARWM